jgi:hypothetical protein
MSGMDAYSTSPAFSEVNPLPRLAQGSDDRHNSRIRKAMATLDKKLDEALAFTGGPE